MFQILYFKMGKKILMKMIQLIKHLVYLKNTSILKIMMKINFYKCK